MFMTKSFWAGGWVIGDADTHKILANENGEDIIFPNREIALAALNLLQSVGAYTKGNAVPYNNSVEASDN